MQREQLEQLLSSDVILEGGQLGSFFHTLLGTELHTFEPIPLSPYLSECFPKETVLNLGIVKS